MIKSDNYKYKIRYFYTVIKIITIMKNARSAKYKVLKGKTDEKRSKA